MSKMTKTQVNHLAERLKVALTQATAKKFPAPKAPSGLDLDCTVESLNKEILESTGYDLLGINRYHARHLLLSLSSQTPDRVKYNEEVKANEVAKAEYHKAKQEEINEILDMAILGDSTEALEALKKFKGNL